jgi:hypothetical protein
VKRSTFVPALLVAAMATLGFGSPASAAPSTPSGASNDAKSSQTAQPPGDLPEIGKSEATPEKPLGPSQVVPSDPKTGMPLVAPSRQNGEVNLAPTANYCGGQFVYIPVVNTGTQATSFKVVAQNQGWERTFFGSVDAGDTAYVPLYGVFGTYVVDLFVWHGDTNVYVFDEFRSGNNTCSINVSAQCNAAAGTVDVTIRNTGTATATTHTERLAPAPYAQWNDQSLPGTTITRSVPVRAPGAAPVSYGIVYHTLGSIYDDVSFVGTC